MQSTEELEPLYIGDLEELNFNDAYLLIEKAFNEGAIDSLNPDAIASVIFGYQSFEDVESSDIKDAIRSYVNDNSLIEESNKSCCEEALDENEDELLDDEFENTTSVSELDTVLTKIREAGKEDKFMQLANQIYGQPSQDDLDELLADSEWLFYVLDMQEDNITGEDEWIS